MLWTNYSYCKYLDNLQLQTYWTFNILYLIPCLSAIDVGGEVSNPLRGRDTFPYRFKVQEKVSRTKYEVERVQ